MTAWNAGQHDVFFALLEEGFPGEFDDHARLAWQTELDGCDPRDAYQALRRMLHQGRTFRPSLSELLKEIRTDPTEPTFAEALQLIYGPGGVMHAQPDRPATGPVRYATETERRAAIDAARTARANEMHPLVTAFVARQGLLRLGTLGIDDADFGGARRHDLQAEWDRHVETFDRRAVAQLATPAGQRQLHQFDPLAALGLTPRPALTEGT